MLEPGMLTDAPSRRLLEEEEARPLVVLTPVRILRLLEDPRPGLLLLLLLLILLEDPLLVVVGILTIADLITVVLVQAIRGGRTSIRSTTRTPSTRRTLRSGGLTTMPTKINVGKHERHVGRLKMLRTGLGQRLRQPLLVNLARV